MSAETQTHAKSGPGRADPYLWRAVAILTTLGATLPVLIGVIAATTGGTDGAGPGAASHVSGSASVANAAGERVYRSSCMVCHGPGGEGVRLLGKPLRNSEFVQTHSDEELFALIVDGRAMDDPANTSGALMPPRGAQALSDEAIRDVIGFLRGMQGEGEPFASVAAWDIRGDASDGGTAAGAAIELTAHPAYDLFVASCAACHGQGGEGIEGLGLPLTTSGFVRGESDVGLVTFIKSGRPLWDANNTTGLDMPPKGGNPAITDEQLQSIVEYLRALQEEALGA